ncbi:penicillin-binding protein [Sinobaca qinghaiensis]|uniref:Penicillin-binding protein n=1 Tax=Sinobaca qinghaiensis TaxID=342944 RepID=A0A419V4J3_9BACL|nr:penicillin-binding transpeptidase domain-containing protein [Sinobaca qinghaiensis]RKD73415.1 penicillin-binding protein [Sinobaca qinghaiensis]
MKKLAGIIGISLLLSACSNNSTAEDAMQAYIEHWNEQEYEEMYNMLSSEAQETVTEEEFTAQHREIYETAGVSEPGITMPEYSEEQQEQFEEQTEPSLPYEAAVETNTGMVEFEEEASWQQEETEGSEEWKVNWEPAFIFPGLQTEERVMEETVEPVRGEILDRNDNSLAVNTSIDQVGIVPGETADEEAAVEELASLLDMEESDITELLSEEWVTEESFVPIKKLTPEESESLQEIENVEGVQSRETTSRYYPLEEQAAHLTGYIGTITEEELEERGEGYSEGATLGKAGAEYIYEDRLRGTPGRALVTTEGGEVIAEQQAEDGETVHLSIDTGVQENLFNELDGDSGTAAALDPKTGETLGLVSTPAYNPNNYLFGWPEGEYEELSEEEGRPFSAKFNSLYAPGSTIKPITASVGMNQGSLQPDEEKTITGEQWQPDSSWGGYSITRVSDRLEQVDLKNALITSDNIFFAQTALNTGEEKFAEGLRNFGFDEELPYDFPVQPSAISNEGLVSDILLADTGYGQGQMMMSPLHLATAYTTFLNEGDMLVPQLERLNDTEPEVWKENVLPEEGADVITEGLRGIVENENGSAYEPVSEDLTIAGKTGTAELKTEQGESGTENGWFVAYDYEQEDLLVSMMIENVEDEGGSAYVVEKVKNVFENRED